MKFKYVDVLRGLAVLGVLIIHCSQFGDNGHFPAIIDSAIRNGERGVQLFYIASAFTLFLSIDRRSQNEKYPIKNFFIRRFFRIAPMYYIGICYYLWQDGLGERYWLGDANSITIWNILSNVLFIHGFNPYWINSIVPGGWSIAVEMLFYCLVPLLFLKIKNTQQAFIFLLLSLIVRLFIQYFFYKLHLISSDMLWTWYMFFCLPSQLPIFALGILFYFILKDNYRISISPGMILLTASILIAQLTGLTILPQYFLFGIAFVILGIALSKYEFKLLVNPIFIHIGKISFSLYLVHFAVLHWLNKYNLVNYLIVTNKYSCILNYSIRLSLLIVISVIVSTFFYKMIEVPLQNMGKQLINKLNN